MSAASENRAEEPPQEQTETIDMAKQSLFKEFLAFVKHEKKWWMIPLMVVLLAIGALIIFAAKSGLGPFVYTLF